MRFGYEMGGGGVTAIDSTRRRWLAVLLAFLLGTAMVFVAASPVSAGGPVNAVWDDDTGVVHPWGTAASVADGVHTEDDLKFVQMQAGSTITLVFPGDYFAVPDGTTGADLRIDIFDPDFPAIGEVFGSADGVSWVSFGDQVDTANIDIDLDDEGTGPIKYVKLEQNLNCSPGVGESGFCIDQAHPTLGFDLDAVIALHAEEFDLLCEAEETCEFEDPEGEWEANITCDDDCTVVFNDDNGDLADLTVDSESAYKIVLVSTGMGTPSGLAEVEVSGAVPASKNGILEMCTGGDTTNCVKITRIESPHTQYCVFFGGEPNFKFR